MSGKIEKCDFCGRVKEEVRHLVQGKEACICDRCAKVCKGLLEEANKREEEVKPPNNRSLVVDRDDPPPAG